MDYRKSNKHKSLNRDFSLYVKQSVNICINICGFMVASYTMASVICIIAGSLPNITYYMPFISKIVKSFFEISAGVKELSAINSEKLRFALICACVSWSGFSVIMQIKSVAGDIIKTKDIFKAKSIQAICSFSLGYGYKNIYKQTSYFTQGLIAIPISVVVAAVILLLFVLNQKKLSEKI